MAMELASRVGIGFKACVLASGLFGLASAQAVLRITSQADGTVVRPGQAVTVAVVASGEPLKGVFTIAGDPIGIRPEIVPAPPYNFTVPIPRKIDSGLHNLTADGYTAMRSRVQPATVSVDVERADSPVNMHADDSYRVHVGATSFSRIMGLFSDGETIDLKRSTLTAFRSDNPSVATVGAYGLVKGVTPGSTKLIVTNGNAKVEIPIIVLRNDEE
jgi:hypothetical protein